MEIQGFFPTGILFHQVSPQLADQIESLIVPRLNNLDYVQTVKTDYFQDKIVSREELKDLIEEIYKNVTYYAKEINEESFGYNYWIQDYSQNDTHKLHSHGRNLFSVVYWVRASKNAGDLVIHETNPFKKQWFSQSTSSIFNYQKIRITPEKGKLVIFPSYLEHEVLPGGENCIRTAIAFNIQ